MATKFRNPNHGPADAQERQVIDLFNRYPEINGLWEPAAAEQGAGLHYYRRINVEPSCMACHGTKAIDFKVGDLRGMDAVDLLEVNEAISQAME